MNFALVILNFNTKNFLEEYLPQVIANSPEGRVWVIDNGSWDGSVEFIKAQFPEIGLVELPQNLGFAGGYQEGLKQIEADWYLLMNSDLVPEKHWLPPLIHTVQENSKIKIVQPFMYGMQQRDTFEYAGGAGGFWDYLGYPFCRGRVFEKLEKDTGQYTSGRIGWASGAALMIEAKTYWASGGLDPYFFAHMEEIDLCWRVQRMGFEIHAVRDSKVYHLGGGTLGAASPMKTYLNFRNNLILSYKNLPRFRFFWVMIARLLLDGVAGLKFIFEGKFMHCLAIIHGHFGFYGYLFKAPKPAQEFSKKGDIQYFKGFILLNYL